jgi:hypothetical protein
MYFDWIRIRIRFDLKEFVTGVGSDSFLQCLITDSFPVYSYKDYEFKGKKVFASIKGDQGVTFMKKKFFQSCLKHIL